MQGILIVDKPMEWTSFDVIAKLRGILGTRKLGHSGTLDPMATGVLPVFCGGASKAVDLQLDHTKTYCARLRLGMQTDTGDITGTVLETAPVTAGEKELLAVLPRFLGPQMQTPPMYSAIKVDGKKLYELAREGKTVELEPRELYISSIDIDGDDDTYKMRIACSKGTYIRTLCEDIGKKLGCGATMSALCRYSSGGFNLDGAVTPEELEALSSEERTAKLIPAEELFPELEKITLTDFYARLCLCGCEIYQKKIGTSFTCGERVRVYTNDGFAGVGEVKQYPDGTAIKLFMRVV